MTWTPEGIKAMLDTFGLPVSCGPFPDDDAGPHAPAPPFLLYDVEKDPYFADNSAYSGTAVLVVEMYTRVREFTQEAALEAVFAENGLSWDCDTDYLQKQKLHVTTYEMGVILSANDGGE